MGHHSIHSTVCAALLSLIAVDALGAPASLKAAYGFAIGAAMNSPQISQGEKALLLAQFTNLTPENCMKPKALQPTEAKFTFETSDALVSFAQQNGLKVNAHTLLWHEACPDWFFQDGGHPASRELALKRMRNHIQTVVTHFRGKVTSWDVVNEAISQTPGEYLRKTKWMSCIGEDFIAEAFRAAREADPAAELYYNDYSIEYREQREKTLRLIRYLKARNVPLDGIGIQGHWQLDQVPLTSIEEAIIAFHAEGLKVMITELDLDVVPRKITGANAGHKESAGADRYPNGLPPEMLRRQAEQYRALFELFRKHSDKISRVTFWGLHDGASWLNHWPYKRTNYPLLWGRDLQPKPALQAVLAVPPSRSLDLLPKN